MKLPNHIYLFIIIAPSHSVSAKSDQSSINLLKIAEETPKTSDDITTTEPSISTTVLQEDPEDVNQIPTQIPKINENSINIKTFTAETNKNEIDNPKYVKGVFGGYYLNDSDDFNFYVHGKYQKPVYNYYGNYIHTVEDKSALGYYLGYAMIKMDHNEYFRHQNFTHFNIHHFYYMNNTMLPEQYIGSDNIFFCAQNTSTFCPENTEALCLRNSTVWCATQMSHVKLCNENDVLKCVTTRVPCIKPNDQNCHEFVEVVKMPCISIITILDSNEDKNGLTFSNVAGTFVLAPVSPVEERTYCVTIVAEPSKNSKSLS